jgi:hypothetical protein
LEFKAASKYYLVLDVVFQACIIRSIHGLPATAVGQGIKAGTLVAVSNTSLIFLSTGAGSEAGGFEA